MEKTPHFLKHPVFINMQSDRTICLDVGKQTKYDTSNPEHTKKIKRLIIIGDSFAETKVDYSYTIQLARLLKCDCVIDYARGGSSMWHAVMQTMQYHETNYRETDYIYIVTSSPYRLPVTESWNEPGSAALLHQIVSGEETEMNSKKVNVKTRHAYEWILENLCTDFQHRVMLQMLISYVKLNFDRNRYLIMPAFTENSDLFDVNNICLFKLSCADIGGDDRWVLPDPRPQHFRKLNHPILATEIAKCMMDRSINKFDTTKFKLKVEYDDWYTRGDEND